MLGLLMTCPAPGRADKKPDQNSSEVAGSSKNWVEELGHESYSVRKEATRRLCEAGFAARDLLQTAAASANAEVALRARQVLDVLAGQLFRGLEVRLTLSESSVVWDKSFDLSLTFRNRSSFRSRIPIEMDAAARARLSADARQVGDLLDVADWLTVRTASGPGDDGEPVGIHIDDILVDSTIAQAVDRRVKGEPISYLPPGESYNFQLTAFNRGWGRYRLLDAGRYTVQFDYKPSWKDEWLVTRNVGRVTSNLVTVDVTTSAPPTVDRGRIEAGLALVKDGQSFVAQVTNRTDLRAVVNRNLGGQDPFAKVQWIHTCDGKQHVIHAGAKVMKTWRDFKGAKLIPVEPGASTPVATIGIDELKTALEARGADLACRGARLHATYESLGNRQWQARQGKNLLGNSDAPDVLRVPLPRRLLAVRLASPSIKTTPGD